MSKTAKGLVEYVKAQVGLPYWYGCYGQLACESLYQEKKKQYSSYYTATDFGSQYGKKVHDCSGLIKGYLWGNDDPTVAVTNYVASQDVNAYTMYRQCSEKGTIDSFPKTNGLLVFRSSKGTESGISHVGVYADGYVYEAKGHSYGVTETKYSQSSWTFWGKHKDIDYGTVTEVGKEEAKASLPTYTNGKTYTVQVDALNVRTGAGTNYAKKAKKDLTADGQKNCNSKGQLNKGTKVTCKATKTNEEEVWMQIPSGWIAAYYDNKYYVK